MTDTRPPPLVPAEVDLRDFAFMPLDVARLRDSDLASDETPEACWAAVLLWCASWHQVPAGSIPDTDTWQAKTAGYVSQGRVAPAWKRIRTGAMRGWLLCSDGRLYHPVVAEKANEAWRGKLQQRWRTEAARVKKHNQRHKLEGSAAVQMPEFEAWMSLGCPQGQELHVPGTEGHSPQGHPPSVPRETASKGQGEGQRQGQGQGDLNVLNPSGSSSAEPTLPGFGGEGTGKPTKPTIPCPYDAVVALYHEALPMLPGVRLMPPARQKALRKVWGWVLSSTKTDGSRRAETAEQALTWLRGYFERAAANDFLMGRSGRSAEHANWKPDLDFLLTDKGMKHVIEKTAA